MSLVLRRALLLAAIVAGAACTEKGRSLVLVDVTQMDVVGVAKVRVVVTQGGRSVGDAETGWSGSGTLKLGVHVDKSARGSVAVVACALGSSGAPLAAGSTAMPPMVTVAPGEQSADLVTMVLAPPGPPSPLCSDGGMAGRGGAGGSTGGMSGSGGGGAGGTSGSGGAGGVSGSGGSVGGTGGNGGTGGGGVTGTGGIAGAGGVGGTGAVAGTGGSSGRGGIGGSAGGRGGAGGSAAGTGGGAAGVGGRGGTTGAAGTGTSGTGGTGTGGTGGTGTAGTGGTAIANPYWRGPLPVANSASTERYPSVAIAFNGKALVAFEHDSEIWISCYDPAANGGQGAWSPQKSISTGGSYAAPVVAVDGTARFQVVYAGAMSGASMGIYEASSSDCVNWSSSTLTTTNAFKPVLALNSDGAGIAAWHERLANTNEQVVARMRTTTRAWGPPQTMLDGDDANDRAPVVAISNTGEAFIVWEQTSVSVNSIWWRKYNGTSWDNMAQLEGFNAGPSYAPGIGINIHGVVVVAYLQRPTPTGNPQLWSQRYASGGFGGPLQLRGAPGMDSVAPSVHVDDNGVATIASTIINGVGQYGVEIVRMTATDPGFPPTYVEDTLDYAGTDTNGTQSPMPVVRGDGKGNFVVVWRKRASAASTRFDIFGRWWTAAVGNFDGEMLLETLDGSNNVFNPALAVNGSGQVVAAWYYGGAGVPVDVWANVWR